MGTDQRAQVWAKTDGHCWYCGKKMNPFEDFTEDHMDPRCQGGSDEVENLQPACKRCNSRKNGRTVEEYRTYLAGEGELRFWGERALQTTDDDLDDEDREQNKPISLEEYNQIARDCLFIGACKKNNLDVIILAFSQLSHLWSRYTVRGEARLQGHGDFTLTKLSRILNLSKYSVFLALLKLNELKIITSPYYRGENFLAFYLDTVELHTVALQCCEEMDRRLKQIRA